MAIPILCFVGALLAFWFGLLTTASTSFRQLTFARIAWPVWFFLLTIVLGVGFVVTAYQYMALRDEIRSFRDFFRVLPA